MKRYYIDFGRESVSQIRELTLEEFNLLSSIIEEAQRGKIIEYPFVFDDILKVYGELCDCNIKRQRENYLWKTLPFIYQNLDQDIVRYFIVECEHYYNLNV